MVSTRVLETVVETLAEATAPPTGVPFSFATDLSIAFYATSGGATRLFFATTSRDTGAWATEGGFCGKEGIVVRVLGYCLDYGEEGFVVWGGCSYGFGGRGKRESLQAYPGRLGQRGGLRLGDIQIECRHMILADLSWLTVKNVQW